MYTKKEIHTGGDQKLRGNPIHAARNRGQHFESLDIIRKSLTLNRSTIHQSDSGRQGNLQKGLRWKPRRSPYKR